ncbi:MAG: PIG-L family deacetylase [Acidaminococcaceae bacterium]|nr:PIG-L family deacetylase [Acidaminococcaceae bacterium]
MENMENEKILVIAAHPDDEVLGAGGTIAKYTAQGADVAVLIVTDGSTSQYRNDSKLLEIIEAKRKETVNCAAVLGVKHIFYGGLPDMKLDVTPHIEINQVIENVIDIFQPNTVFTHFFGDINKDHQRVSESTLVACRPTAGQCVKRVFLYSVPSSTEWNIQVPTTIFIPNWYENISGEYAEKKYKAMECYKTELREFPHPRSIQYLRVTDMAEGNRVGLLAAESFMLVRSVK